MMIPKALARSWICSVITFTLGACARTPWFLGKAAHLFKNVCAVDCFQACIF